MYQHGDHSLKLLRPSLHLLPSFLLTQYQHPETPLLLPVLHWSLSLDLIDAASLLFLPLLVISRPLVQVSELESLQLQIGEPKDFRALPAHALVLPHHPMLELLPLRDLPLTFASD